MGELGEGRGQGVEDTGEEGALTTTPAKPGRSRLERRRLANTREGLRTATVTLYPM